MTPSKFKIEAIGNGTDKHLTLAKKKIEYQEVHDIKVSIGLEKKIVIHVPIAVDIDHNNVELTCDETGPPSIIEDTFCGLIFSKDVFRNLLKGISSEKIQERKRIYRLVDA